MNKKTTTAIQVRTPTSESLVPDAKNLSEISKMLLDSGMWPKLKPNGVPGIFAIIEYGRELGIPPVAALNTIVIVSGRLTMEAKAMLAVANQRAGVTWEVESTDKGCTITFSRPGFKSSLKSVFNEADAKAAGLLQKDNWKAYPKDMYFARAAARGVRQIAPDAVLGLYLPEEAQDFIMPAAGEIVEVKPEPQKELKAEKKEEPEKETLPTPEPKPATKTKPTEQPKPATTSVKDDKAMVIEKIKKMLAEKTFDPKNFKIFLYDFAKTHKVKFVELNRFKNLSFHEGDLNDLHRLIVNFEWLSKEYLEWAKLYKPEAKEPEEGVENGGPGEGEPPF